MFHDDQPTRLQFNFILYVICSTTDGRSPLNASRRTYLDELPLPSRMKVSKLSGVFLEFDQS